VTSFTGGTLTADYGARASFDPALARRRPDDVVCGSDHTLR
jgi:hypothetical protein